MLLMILTIYEPLVICNLLGLKFLRLIKKAIQL
jgi:hypothetical protein